MRAPDPAGPLRQQLFPAPFTDVAGTRPKGVYLHWALPDALTREQPVGTGSAMPSMPDRWLVTRLSLATTPDARRTTSWVIEASRGTPTVTPLASWTESGVLPVPGFEPTALGHGDLGWSAYYDNVVNRLGFFDPLTDGATGPLAYVVCGWYADPRLDPLADAAIGSLSDFYAKLETLGWSLPAGELEVDVLAAPAFAPSDLARAAVAGGRAPLITDGSWWPTGLLCHGSVVGIGWPEAGFPFAEDGLLGSAAGGPPAPSETRVAFGSTPTDALGALMVGFLAAAQGVPTDDVMSEDRMLEAFQLGLLAEIDQPDGRARLDAGLHASAFHQTPGGQVTDHVPPPEAPAAPVAPPGLVPQAPRIATASSGGGLAADLGTVEPGGLETLLATTAVRRTTRRPRMPSSARSRAGSPRASPRS